MSGLEKKQIIYVLGGPGSGKGTQTSWIAEKYGLGYLSTGDILRSATAEGKEKVEDLQKIAPEGQDPLEFAETLRNKMKSGDLVDDDIVISLVKSSIESSDKEYFLVDGFPRNLDQARNFDSTIKECTAVLYLTVSDEILVERLLNRGKTSGRADDNAESIKNRIANFHKITQPVIDYYEPLNKVIEVDASPSINTVRAHILAELRKYWDLPKQDDEPVADELEEKALQAKKNSKCCLLL